MSYTVDANVLLYASDESSPVHARARDLVGRLADGPEIAYLFWPTVMAYLRIATHPAVFTRPLSITEAVGNIEQLLARPHVRTTGEGEAFWRSFRERGRRRAAVGEPGARRAPGHPDAGERRPDDLDAGPGLPPLPSNRGPRPVRVAALGARGPLSGAGCRPRAVCRRGRRRRGCRPAPRRTRRPRAMASGPTVSAIAGWSSTTARIAVPISWPTVSSPTVSRRPVSSSCRNWVSRSLVSIATVILPLPNWSIHMKAANSSVGRRRTSSLPTRSPVAVAVFSTLSSVSPEISASRASSIAALPMSIEGSRIDGGLLRLDDGLHREREVVVQPQAVPVDGAHDRGHGLPDAAALAVHEVLADDPVHRLRERALVEVRSGRAQALERPGHRRRVPQLEPVDQVQEVHALVLGEPADEPEVEEDDPPGLRLHEDVAGVRVAVEEAVHQDLLDQRPDEDRSDLLAVDAGGVEGGDVADLVRPSRTRPS